MKTTKILLGVGILCAICLVAAPIAFAVTIALIPLWSWIESRFAIESLGHSGPAEWCYLASYTIILTCAAIIWLVIRRRSGI